jgi:hypothetical protein
VHSAPSTSQLSPQPLCLHPKRTDDTSKWSTKEFIEKNLPFPISPTPMFWDGYAYGRNVLPFAERCALRKGAATISMIMCEGGGFLMPHHPTTVPGGHALWEYASKVYAQHTKGMAWGVFGDDVNNSTWTEVEYPTLRENPDVTAVIALDLETCDPRCYWHCNNLNAGPCKVRVWLFHL